MDNKCIQDILGAMQKNMECSICLDLLSNPTSTSCDHTFCRFCIMEFLKTKRSVPCPLCKTPITKRSLVDRPQLSHIISNVRQLLAAFSKDIGQSLSPSRCSNADGALPCTPEQQNRAKDRRVTEQTNTGTDVCNTEQGIRGKDSVTSKEYLKGRNTCLTEQHNSCREEKGHKRRASEPGKRKCQRNVRQSKRRKSDIGPVGEIEITSLDSDSDAPQGNMVKETEVLHHAQNRTTCTLSSVNNLDVSSSKRDGKHFQDETIDDNAKANQILSSKTEEMLEYLRSGSCGGISNNSTGSGKNISHGDQIESIKQHQINSKDNENVMLASTSGRNSHNRNEKGEKVHRNLRSRDNRICMREPSSGSESKEGQSQVSGDSHPSALSAQTLMPHVSVVTRTYEKKFVESKNVKSELKVKEWLRSNPVEEEERTCEDSADKQENEQGIGDNCSLEDIPVSANPDSVDSDILDSHERDKQNASVGKASVVLDDKEAMKPSEVHHKIFKSTRNQQHTETSVIQQKGKFVFKKIRPKPIKECVVNKEVIPKERKFRELDINTFGNESDPYEFKSSPVTPKKSKAIKNYKHQKTDKKKEGQLGIEIHSMQKKIHKKSILKKTSENTDTAVKCMEKEVLQRPLDEVNKKDKSKMDRPTKKKTSPKQIQMELEAEKAINEMKEKISQAEDYDLLTSTQEVHAQMTNESISDSETMSTRSKRSVTFNQDVIIIDSQNKSVIKNLRESDLKSKYSTSNDKDTKSLLSEKPSDQSLFEHQKELVPLTKYPTLEKKYQNVLSAEKSEEFDSFREKVSKSDSSQVTNSHHPVLSDTVPTADAKDNEDACSSGTDDLDIEPDDCEFEVPNLDIQPVEILEKLSSQELTTSQTLGTSVGKENSKILIEKMKNKRKIEEFKETNQDPSSGISCIEESQSQCLRNDFQREPEVTNDPNIAYKGKTVMFSKTDEKVSSAMKKSNQNHEKCTENVEPNIAKTTSLATNCNSIVFHDKCDQLSSGDIHATSESSTDTLDSVTEEFIPPFSGKSSCNKLKVSPKLSNLKKKNNIKIKYDEENCTEDIHISGKPNESYVDSSKCKAPFKADKLKAKEVIPETPLCVPSEQNTVDDAVPGSLSTQLSHETQSSESSIERKLRSSHKKSKLNMLKTGKSFTPRLIPETPLMNLVENEVPTEQSQVSNSSVTNTQESVSILAPPVVHKFGEKTENVNVTKENWKKLYSLQDPSKETDTPQKVRQTSESLRNKLEDVNPIHEILSDDEKKTETVDTSQEDMFLCSGESLVERSRKVILKRPKRKCFALTSPDREGESIEGTGSFKVNEFRKKEISSDKEMEDTACSEKENDDLISINKDQQENNYGNLKKTTKDGGDFGVNSKALSEINSETSRTSESLNQNTSQILKLEKIDSEQVPETCLEDEHELTPTLLSAKSLKKKEKRMREKPTKCSPEDIFLLDSEPQSSSMCEDLVQNQEGLLEFDSFSEGLDGVDVSQKDESSDQHCLKRNGLINEREKERKLTNDVPSSNFEKENELVKLESVVNEPQRDYMNDNCLSKSQKDILCSDPVKSNTVSSSENRENENKEELVTLKAHGRRPVRGLARRRSKVKKSDSEESQLDSSSNLSLENKKDCTNISPMEATGTVEPKKGSVEFTSHDKMCKEFMNEKSVLKTQDDVNLKEKLAISEAEVILEKATEEEEMDLCRDDERHEDGKMIEVPETVENNDDHFEFSDEAVPETVQEDMDIGEEGIDDMQEESVQDDLNIRKEKRDDIQKGVSADYEEGNVEKDKTNLKLTSQKELVPAEDPEDYSSDDNDEVLMTRNTTKVVLADDKCSSSRESLPDSDSSDLVLRPEDIIYYEDETSKACDEGEKLNISNSKSHSGSIEEKHERKAKHKQDMYKSLSDDESSEDDEVIVRRKKTRVGVILDEDDESPEEDEERYTEGVVKTENDMNSVVRKRSRVSVIEDDEEETKDEEVHCLNNSDNEDDLKTGRSVSDGDLETCRSESDNEDIVVVGRKKKSAVVEDDDRNVNINKKSKHSGSWMKNSSKEIGKNGISGSVKKKQINGGMKTAIIDHDNVRVTKSVQEEKIRKPDINKEWNIMDLKQVNEAVIEEELKAVDSVSDEEDLSDSSQDSQQSRHLNFTSSSAFSSQSEAASTQQQMILHEDLKRMQKEIAEIESRIIKTNEKCTSESEKKCQPSSPEELYYDRSYSAYMKELQEEQELGSSPLSQHSQKLAADVQSFHSDDSNDLFLSPQPPSPPPSDLPVSQSGIDVPENVTDMEKFLQELRDENSPVKSSPSVISDEGGPYIENNFDKNMYANENISPSAETMDPVLIAESPLKSPPRRKNIDRLKHLYHSTPLSEQDSNSRSLLKKKRDRQKRLVDSGKKSSLNFVLSSSSSRDIHRISQTDLSEQDENCLSPVANLNRDGSSSNHTHSSPKKKKVDITTSCKDIAESSKSDNSYLIESQDIVENPRLTVSHSNMVGTDHSKVFVASGLQYPQMVELQKLLQSQDCKLCSKFSASVTHVIIKTDPISSRVCERTLKFFQAVVNGCWILDFEWVTDSLAAGHFLHEAAYEVIGDTVTGKRHKGPRKSRMRNLNDPAILDDLEFYVIGSSKGLTPDSLTELILRCGGSVVQSPDRFSSDRLGIVVTCVDLDSEEEEHPSSQEVTFFNKLYVRYNVVTVSREWLLDTLTVYELQPLHDYVLTSVKGMSIPKILNR